MAPVPPARSASHRRIVVEAGALGLLVGLLVVLPWVAGGYVLLLDWVSGPSSTISPGLYGLSDNALDAMPWRLGIEAMRTVFGAQATSWLIVLLPFPIAAAGAAHLMRMGRLPSYAAAIAAVCTPVVVDRVMAGHVAYLLGISLLPWLLSSALNARTQQRWFSARTAGWYALAIAVSPHMAWIGGMVLLLVTLLPRMSARDVVRLLLTGLAAAAIYSYAAVVVLSGVPTLRIGSADLEAFATASGPGGILPTVLTLQGFWRDWDNQVRLVLGPAFWLLVAAVGAVIVLGLVGMLRQGNRRGRLAVAFIVVGAILAAGTQGPFGWLYQWAFDTVPLFTTMREPAKWLALVQLGYVIGFAAGVQALQTSARVPAALRRPLPVVAMLLPLAVLPALAWGLGGRVSTTEYPAGWAAAAARLDPAPARLLFLPWHGYQPFAFTQDRTVATPAGAYFPGSVLSSSAVEVGPLRSDSTSRQQARMDELVASGGGADFASSLANLGITHVALSRGPEDDRYAWVAQQPNLTQVLDDPALALYRVDVPVAGLDRLKTAGPAQFTVLPGTPGTVILPVEYSTGWELDGRPGTATPEGTIAFEVGAEEAQIVYRPWSRIKLGIIASLGALMVILVAGLVEHRADLRPRRRTEQASPHA
jgi:hypothetical protein